MSAYFRSTVREFLTLDLRDFHRESRGRVLVPILVTSRGDTFAAAHCAHDDPSVKDVLRANDESLHAAILHASEVYSNACQADSLRRRNAPEESSGRDFHLNGGQRSRRGVKAVSSIRLALIAGL